MARDTVPRAQGNRTAVRFGVHAVVPEGPPYGAYTLCLSRAEF